MFKFIPLTTVLLCSILTAESTMQHHDNNTTDTNATEAITPNIIKVKTVRNIVGSNNPIEHSRGQLRAGYITFREENNPSSTAYGLAGHYHFDSKRWYGLKAGLSAYTVLNLGVNQNPEALNGDFFNAQGKSFIQWTEAYLDGKWGNTEIILGRQILNTPHADSDDIRMIPNYFEAYTLNNTDIKNLTLSLGFINRMAGWENGIDPSKFVKISETLGGSEKTDGLFYASALYQGFKELSLSLWYYNYVDMAEVLYAEAAYHIHISKDTVLTTGLQYDGSKDNGHALLPTAQNANTYGISMELAAEEKGLHLLAAYNKDNSQNGAMGLSLGGGPFFTSMEDQTLDAIGSAGDAWMVAAGYHFETLGIKGLHAGLAYGDFTSKNAALYDSQELDVIMDYTLSEVFSITAAFASVTFSDTLHTDYNQFRIVSNYSF